MTIWYKHFCYNNVPLANNKQGSITLREIAAKFANKVEQTGTYDTKGNVINISETETQWGNSITVWYKAMKKVEA